MNGKLIMIIPAGLALGCFREKGVVPHTLRGTLFGGVDVD